MKFPRRFYTSQLNAARRRRLRTRVNNLCHNCAQRPPGLNQDGTPARWCDKCRQQQAPSRIEYEKTRRSLAVESGNCIACYRRPQRPSAMTCSVCAEKISQRAKEKRKARGAKIGRPKRHLPIDEAQRLASYGMSWTSIAKQLSVPLSTLMGQLRQELERSAQPEPASSDAAGQST